MLKRSLRVSAGLLFSLLFALSASYAQNSPEIPGTGFILGQSVPIPLGSFKKPIKTKLLLPNTEFASGKSYPVLLEIVIGEEYHINSKKPIQPTLIPTRVKLKTSDPRATVGRVIYPKPKLKKFKFSPEKLSIYDGTVYIASSVSLSSEEIKEPVTLTVTLDYQACTDEACLLPDEATAEAVMRIGKEGQAINEKLFSKYASEITDIGITTGDIFKNLDGSIGLAAILLIFLGGMALNLTPCVYPMIPVTVSYFGSASGRSKLQTLLHASIYLFGMAIMYSVLGVMAAVTGSLFGEMMQNTFVIILLVVIMLALSASMFGVWHIAVPASLMKISGKKYGGVFGTFFMGLTVGIIMAPCVGPFVIGLLTFVGEKQDPVLGFVLFFILAIGLGLPTLILGLSSGMIKSLPRSGVWMLWVEKFFGVVMIGMALYFAQPLIPDPAYIGYLAFAIASIGGIYLIFAGRKIGGGVFNTFRFGIGVGMVAVGIWYLPATGAATEELPFIDYSNAAFEEAVKSEKPIILDFYADWCLPCKELKIFTFGDPRVVARKDEFVPILADFTRLNDANKAVKKKFNVIGLPTILLFDKNGNEVERIIGYITADELLEKLEPLLEG